MRINLASMDEHPVATVRRACMHLQVTPSLAVQRGDGVEAAAEAGGGRAEGGHRLGHDVKRLPRARRVAAHDQLRHEAARRQLLRDLTEKVSNYNIILRMCQKYARRTLTSQERTPPV